jgi:hypothetical protein
VFADDCRVLTTYSYRDQKRFYPVHVQPDPRSAGADLIECFPTNLANGLTNQTFSRNELRLREDAFSRSCAQDATHDNSFQY